MIITMAWLGHLHVHHGLSFQTFNTAGCQMGPRVWHLYTSVVPSKRLMPKAIVEESIGSLCTAVTAYIPSQAIQSTTALACEMRWLWAQSNWLRVSFKASQIKRSIVMAFSKTMRSPCRKVLLNVLLYCGSFTLEWKYSTFCHQICVNIQCNL